MAMSTLSQFFRKIFKRKKRKPRMTQHLESGSDEIDIRYYPPMMYRHEADNHEIYSDYLPSMRDGYVINVSSLQCQIIQVDDDREKCIRDAIRQHTLTLVDTLPFTSSEIPDRIIDEGIATPTESESLRKLRTTEDQVSGLVSMVITKGATAMEKFLEIVAVHNPDVVERIQNIYHDRYKERKQHTKEPCVLCNLTEKCDIKLVHNYFFARGHISASLHRRVVHSELPVGCQNRLWYKMIHEFGIRPDCSVIRILVEAMEHDGCCNSNVIEMLKRLLRKNMPLECICYT